MKRIILLSVCIFCYYSSIKGQELSIEDSTIVDAIKEKTSKIYNNKDKTSFSLTKKQLRGVKTYGTNIVINSKRDTINKIVTTSLTKKGQLSTEWYFSKNKLIFVYESFEFFEEQKKKSNWKNFKGFNAWESRYYIVDDEIKYQKHKGRVEVKRKIKTNNIVKDGKIILNFVMQ